MAWDCKHKTGNGECYRLGKKCAPGDPGCVLAGKFVFPFKENDSEENRENGKNTADIDDQTVD